MTREILKKYFGYDDFRDCQEEIIDNILNGRDALGIMPTGAGKSICYQVPAMLFSGITLVVSPLISLMQDQVKSLIQAGISAAYINSSLTQNQINLALNNAKNGKYKIIYVAPERLMTPSFLNFCMCSDISMLTIDEAHCISQWGQDFRPSYAQIPEFIASLSKRPVVSAFTATATSRVKSDIVQLLQLNNPLVLVSGFDRENLYFQVKQSSNKFTDLIQFLKDKDNKSGIIYCSTRKNVDEVCAKLIELGFLACRYHAGLSQEARFKAQNDFVFDKVDIIVATNAFGMGIDKSNVNYVVHYNMPKDMESYYQEAGRAGRDGTNAHCLLLYSGQDVVTNRFLIEQSTEESIDEETSEFLRQQAYDRLKQITFYSTTNDCLRAFILKYFGESPLPYCGNCSKCDTDFEKIDATIEAQKIISCIKRTGERFGRVLIIDVLKGNKNQTALQYRFDKLSTYGISSESPPRLRSIIDNLIFLGYLTQEESAYASLKLTPTSIKILNGTDKIEIKVPKITKIKATEKKAVKTSNTVEVPEDREDLFDNLRDLRAELARKQGVPAFVVFGDNTLKDMCLKLPTTSDEFLEVSGVGYAKRLYNKSWGGKKEPTKKNKKK